ncbi:MAG: ornithine cyclodeaminase family protein [Candidatus Melainabacteria bacterium]|nr:ornithine cyclodeaminase family protein [Candidatus Melainabacteria bacterium]
MQDSASHVLYLSRSDVERTNLTMSTIIDALCAAFFELGNGRVEMPPKIGLHSQPDAFVHAMPAYIPALNSLGLKWVSGYPGNQKLGLPYITGLLILNDVDTGVPVSVMDCTWITAQRTGAATALSAKYLARQDSRTVGILGCGAQGRSNLEAFLSLFDIKQVTAYDTDRESLDRYASEMQERWGVPVARAKEAKEAVVGHDLIVTSGPILRTPHGTIKNGWFGKGSFASLVDFDSYWEPRALFAADKFTTDDSAQLEHFRQMGYFQNIPPIYADLCDLVTGKKAGRVNDDERTIALNLGLALDDMAVAPLVYRRALEMGIGVRLPL